MHFPTRFLFSGKPLDYEAEEKVSQESARVVVYGTVSVVREWSVNECINTVIVTTHPFILPFHVRIKFKE